METERTVYGQTPNGGVLAVIYFRGIDGGPTTEDSASFVEIIEYDEKGNALFRTYGASSPSSSSTSSPAPPGSGS